MKWNLVNILNLKKNYNNFFLKNFINNQKLITTRNLIFNKCNIIIIFLCFKNINKNLLIIIKNLKNKIIYLFIKLDFYFNFNKIIKILRQIRILKKIVIIFKKKNFIKFIKSININYYKGIIFKRFNLINSNFKTFCLNVLKFEFFCNFDKKLFSDLEFKIFKIVNFSYIFFCIYVKNKNIKFILLGKKSEKLKKILNRIQFKLKINFKIKKIYLKIKTRVA